MRTKALQEVAQGFVRLDRKGPSESAVKGGFRVLDQPRHAAVILQPEPEPEPEPDPENVAGAPVEEIGQRSAGEESVRKSAVRSHESSGRVENWIQRCAAQTKIVRFSADIVSSLTSPGIQDTADHAVYAAAKDGNFVGFSSNNNDIQMWMIRRAAWVHRFQLYLRDRAPYFNRTAGCDYKKLARHLLGLLAMIKCSICSLGEFAQRKFEGGKTAERNKLSDRWTKTKGIWIWLGKADMSEEEHLVYDENAAVRKYRTVRTPVDFRLARF